MAEMIYFSDAGGGSKFVEEVFFGTEEIFCAKGSGAKQVAHNRGLATFLDENVSGRNEGNILDVP